MRRPLRAPFWTLFWVFASSPRAPPPSRTTAAVCTGPIPHLLRRAQVWDLCAPCTAGKNVNGKTWFPPLRMVGTSSERVRGHCISCAEREDVQFSPCLWVNTGARPAGTKTSLSTPHLWPVASQEPLERKGVLWAPALVHRHRTQVHSLLRNIRVIWRTAGLLAGASGQSHQPEGPGRT